MTGKREHAEQLISNTGEAAVVSLANKSTWWGAFASVVGGLSVSDYGVLVGIAIGLAGLAINLIFSVRRDRRERRELALQEQLAQQKLHDERGSP
jgi:hypothetical protein